MREQDYWKRTCRGIATRTEKNRPVNQAPYRCQFEKTRLARMPYFDFVTVH